MARSFVEGYTRTVRLFPAMRWVRTEPGRGSPPLGLILGATLAVGAALNSVFRLVGFAPICRIRQWTGIPCPTCGGSRMVEALLAGDPLRALAWNPLLFTVLAGVSVWAVASAVRFAFALPAWRLELTRREQRVAWFVGLLFIVAGWLYLVVTGV